jgi:hypothetical protein
VHWLQVLRWALQPKTQGVLCSWLPLHETWLEPAQVAPTLSGVKLTPSLHRESNPPSQRSSPGVQVWQAPVLGMQPSGQKVTGPNEVPSGAQVRLLR